MEYTFENLKATLALVELQGDQIKELYLKIDQLSEQLTNATALAETLKDVPAEDVAPTPEEFEKDVVGEDIEEVV